MTGHYPFNSAYGKRAKLAFIPYRESTSIYPTSGNTMWITNWFFAPDALGEWECSIWNGTSWEPYRISIRPF